MLAYMLIAKYTTFKLQFKLFECFVTVVDNVHIGQKIGTADPDLSMQTCSSCDITTWTQEACLRDSQWTW